MSLLGRCVILGLLGTTVSHASATPRHWSLVETARDGDRRLAEVPLAAPAAPPAADATFVVEPAQVRHEIVGFGGALTESSAWVLAQLPQERREEILRRYFDPHDGIGYTLARTHINSCDFSLRSWALDETPGDVELKDFTLAPMRAWVMPLLHDARRIAGGERLRLLASPWSPPAWMKTNGEMAHGGRLRPQYADAWARYFVKFIEAMEREEHIPVWGLTVQNEPEAVQVWESCIYSPAEEAAFVRDHLGPALAAAGRGGVRLLGHDHNRDIIEAHADALFGDPACAQYLWGVGVHWYVSDDYAASARVLAKFPDKHVLFTEGCLEAGAKVGQWDRGERYATSIFQDLRHGVCGWIDWNIVLDERGGPNHVGNFCDAPVIADLRTDTVHYQSSFHYIGHFSRYVPPGSRMVASRGGPAGLDSIAFVRPDGAVVFVVMNKSDAAATFALQVDDDRIECALPPHAIQTYIGASADGAGGAFSIEDRRILRDGQPFQVRGVCYQPAPIGDDPTASAPYGDYYTAGYAALTARDLPNIRALGANVIRIYGWDPVADHTAFLDACYNGGVDPIFVIVNRWIDPATAWSSDAAVDAIRQQFLQIDAGLGAHPAVLAIVLGNETNAHYGNGTNAAYWAAIASVAASIKQQTPSRLVSVAITDALPQVAARDAAMGSLDFWCVQSYRGTSLGTLFADYASASARPLVITEFGIDAYDHASGQPYADNAGFTGATVAALWTEIAANAATCAGACVFEYADEWWKSSSGSPSTHDTGGFPLGSLPDGFANEEWWGLYAVSDGGSAPDTLAARATVSALRAAWTPPVVTVVAAPVSQTIAPGGSATLTVQAAASGGAAVAYQWLKDGVAIAGATGASLALAGLSAADSGWYAVRISAGATLVTTPAARLLVAQPDPGRIVNISLRGRPGEGESVLIAGFILDGNVPRRLLVRGVGPELLRMGVADAHPDPFLRLYDGDGVELASNDDWDASGDAAEIAAVARAIGAFSLAAGGKDAVLLRTVLPGAFTAHVSGPAGTSGIALVEVYEVP